ncbi:AAA family ATPase [Candidatus Woesearchaeota archaeon]|nr:AAA family ATPase [Candidatus Woesearchaeota archaeon]
MADTFTIKSKAAPGRVHVVEQHTAQMSSPADLDSKAEYIKTGITGFDEMMTRGIPKGSQILVSGGPGTLKTTFCMQVLVNAAKENKKCLYLTFEESVQNILRNFHDYGWDLSGLIKSGNLVIIHQDPFKMSRSVETLLAQARGELLIDVNEAKNLVPENMKPHLVVVDSLSAISAGFFGRDEGYRAYISQIFDTFRKLNTTSFMITEIEYSTTKYSKSGVEEFLADAVFVNYNMIQGSQRINATEIVKLRGSEHKKKIVPLKAIPQKGIVVYPSEEIFTSEKP